MTKTDFSDETLMRFADGELDPKMAAEIERAMETDDELVPRVAFFLETRAAAQTALEPLLDEPVPAELTQAIEAMVAKKKADDLGAASVLPFRRRTANDQVVARRWFTPIAASLTAILGGLGGYWLAQSEEPASAELHVAGVSASALNEALATVASGQERQLAGSNQRFRAIATFRDNTQALCREFEVDSPDRSTVVSVACRSGEQWRVAFAVAAAGGSGGYAPASSTDALDAYLSAIDAKPPIEASEETKALAEIRDGAQK
jgi:anti-sigma factor RsiW